MTVNENHPWQTLATPSPFSHLSADCGTLLQLACRLERVAAELRQIDESLKGLPGTPLSSLDGFDRLSKRVRKALEARGIENATQLSMATLDQILQYRGFGSAAIVELENWMKSHGLRCSEHPPYYLNSSHFASLRGAVAG
jgi:hypothetical protein